MPQTKEQKRKIIDKLKDKLERQKVVLFFDFKGLKVKDLSGLKKKLKEAESELLVAKKTLLNLASKEKKTPLDAKKLDGQIAIIFGFKDQILPAKIAYQFSMTNDKLKILGGIFEGELVGKERIIEISQLPSREELLARLFFTTKLPIFGLFNTLQRGLSILKVSAKGGSA